MNLYKDILETMPTAAIVVDEKFRVRYCNRAFREYFGSSIERGAFKDAVCCLEPYACGEGKACSGCTLHALFRDILSDGKPAFRKLLLRHGTETFALRMKVQPMGKLFLGLIDNAYELEIAREMTSAQDIQQRLLPPAKSRDYAFMYVPCREIGGDLPDVYETSGGTMGLLADVSGKGISAGMLSAFVKAGWDRSELSPARALCGLNAKFLEMNPDERSYVTAIAVRIDKAAGEIYYCVAGHNAPMLLKTGQGISEIVMNSPPVSNWIPDYKYEDRRIEFSRGDILVLLTDGVTESRNAAGEQFSLERVEDLLQHASRAEVFIDRLHAALKEFCGTFHDDITAIAFDL